MIIRDRRHLERVIDDYVDHYNGARPHCGLQLRPPNGQVHGLSATGAISCRTRLGGSLLRVCTRAEVGCCMNTCIRPAAECCSSLPPGGFEDLVRATSLPAGTRSVPPQGGAPPDKDRIKANVATYGGELLA